MLTASLSERLVSLSFSCHFREFNVVQESSAIYMHNQVRFLLAQYCCGILAAPAHQGVRCPCQQGHQQQVGCHDDGTISRCPAWLRFIFRFVKMLYYIISVSQIQIQAMLFISTLHVQLRHYNWEIALRFIYMHFNSLTFEHNAGS